MTLELWTNPHSRGRIAHWMLEELGQPYETHWLDYGPSGSKSAEFLAINPMGKFPALRHDGKVVTEAAAICTYLADAFPDAGLKPEPDALGDYYRWMFYAAGPMEQAIYVNAMQWESPPEGSKSAGFGTYSDMVETVAGWLGDREWACGTRFSALDVYLGAQISFGLQFDILPKRPEFEAYSARLLQREALRRVDALCAEQMT